MYGERSFAVVVFTILLFCLRQPTTIKYWGVVTITAKEPKKKTENSMKNWQQLETNSIRRSFPYFALFFLFSVFFYPFSTSFPHYHFKLTLGLLTNFSGNSKVIENSRESANQRKPAIPTPFIQWKRIWFSEWNCDTKRRKRNTWMTINGGIVLQIFPKNEIEKNQWVEFIFSFPGKMMRRTKNFSENKEKTL